MEFFSLTYPWYDHTRKRQFLFISLYPLSFDEGRTSGAGVRPLSLPAQPALRHIQNGRRRQAPALRVCRAQTCCAPTHPPEYFSGMAPAAARRARPVQRSSYQGLRGNPDACRPRRGSACDVSEHGAPAEAQRSGFGGERRHSGGNELCRLRRSERSVTCADEAGGNARPVLAGQLQPTAALDPGSRARRPWWFSHRF